MLWRMQFAQSVCHYFYLCNVQLSKLSEKIGWFSKASKPELAPNQLWCCVDVKEVTGVCAVACVLCINIKSAVMKPVSSD